MAEAEQGSGERAAWMAVLAQAAPAALGQRLSDCLAERGGRPAHRWLRAPETGAVMVRGRAGGTGAAFNLGEMTVTRASLALEDGTVGHAWVPGRDRGHAGDAALADALLQREESRAAVEASVIRPLAAAAAAAKAARGRKAAATKVDFFTMVRGED